ncbi:MAG: hypothetical protein ABL958_13475 [Bdellovibrionia bacterium]
MKQTLIILAILLTSLTSYQTWANDDEDFDLTTMEDALDAKVENKYDQQRKEKYANRRRLPEVEAREYNSGSTNNEAENIAGQLFGTKYGKTAAVEKADLPK